MKKPVLTVVQSEPQPYAEYSTQARALLLELDELGKKIAVAPTEGRRFILKLRIDQIEDQLKHLSDNDKLYLPT